MESKESRPHLVIFECLTTEQLKSDFVASAFQSLETALFLLSDRRWPGALVTVWDACEKILRAHYYVKNGKLPSDTMTAYELQRDFEIHQEITFDLTEASHVLRKKRNDISHKGYSPRDDDACVELFFSAGVPYFNFVAKFALGSEIREYIPNTHEWFWEIFQITRDAVKAEIAEKSSPVSALILLEFAAGKVFKIGTAHKSLSPINWEKYTLEQLFQDVAHEVNYIIMADFISEIGESFRVNGANCPICNEELLISATSFDCDPKPESTLWKNFGLRGLWCPECRYVLRSELLVKKLVRKKKWSDSIDAITNGKVEPISIPFGVPKIE
jgi:hypothetical protein